MTLVQIERVAKALADKTRLKIYEQICVERKCLLRRAGGFARRYARNGFPSPEGAF